MRLVINSPRLKSVVECIYVYILDCSFVSLPPAAAAVQADIFFYYLSAGKCIQT